MLLGWKTPALRASLFGLNNAPAIIVPDAFVLDVLQQITFTLVPQLAVAIALAFGLKVRLARH